MSCRWSPTNAIYNFYHQTFFYSLHQNIPAEYTAVLTWQINLTVLSNSVKQVPNILSLRDDLRILRKKFNHTGNPCCFAVCTNVFGKYTACFANLKNDSRKRKKGVVWWSSHLRPPGGRRGELAHICRPYLKPSLTVMKITQMKSDWLSKKNKVVLQHTVIPGLRP